MDINVLRGLITVLSFAIFIAIVLWAWSGRQRKRFEEAARLPFEEGDELVPPGPAAPGRRTTGARGGPVQGSAETKQTRKFAE